MIAVLRMNSPVYVFAVHLACGMALILLLRVGEVRENVLP
jgi:hypothetical protein